jgi:hypothetical protein
LWLPQPISGSWVLESDFPVLSSHLVVTGTIGTMRDKSHPYCPRAVG